MQLKPTKKDLLLTWMINKGIFRTSEVINYGHSIYSNRADRDKRQFVSEGIIIALSEAEKKTLGYNTIEGIYCSRPRYFLHFPEKAQMELAL